MLSQAELETEGSGLATIFGLPPTPRYAPDSRMSPNGSKSKKLQKRANLTEKSHCSSKEPWESQKEFWDETRNAEWWGELHIQIKQKSQFEIVPQDTSEFKSNQNLNSTLYREIPRNLIFSILTSWLKSPHHSGFRLPFNSAFRVSSSTERADKVKDWRPRF